VLLPPISATATLTSDAPREYVWRAFESAPRWPEVLKDLAEAQVEPNGRLEQGSIMRSRAVPGTMAVDMEYRVLEAERPHRLVTESKAAGFSAHTEYRFAEGAHGGTQVTIIGQVRADKASMRLYIAIQRRRHIELVEGSLHRRMRSMLDLAEKIWREETQGH
jgi:hypothetical protein